MASLVRSWVEGVLFLYFLFVVLVAPLMHSDDWLPLFSTHDQIIPQFLLDFKNWFSVTTDNYMLSEKPPIFVLVVGLFLPLVWPLSVANLYGILASKSWFSTTCLISGVALFSAIAALIPEAIGSGKGADKLLMFYCFNLGFGFLAFLRGLFGNSSASMTPTTIKSSSAHQSWKKMA